MSGTKTRRELRRELADTRRDRERRGSNPSKRHLVYVVPGHGQKGPNYYDPGAVAGPLVEARSVREIATKMETMIASAGFADVIIDGEGSYAARHRRLAVKFAGGAYEAAAVIHLHHDAAASPSTRTSLVMHDRRSMGGAALSVLVLRERTLACAPWGMDVRVVPTWNDRAEKGGWKHRAYFVMDEVFLLPAGVSATLVECGMITHAATREWFQKGTGHKPTAAAIVAGVKEWLKLKSRTKKEA